MVTVVFSNAGTRTPWSMVSKRPTSEGCRKHETGHKGGIMSPGGAGPDIAVRVRNHTFSRRLGRKNRGASLHPELSGSLCRTGTRVELSSDVSAYLYSSGSARGRFCAALPGIARAPRKQKAKN